MNFSKFWDNNRLTQSASGKVRRSLSTPNFGSSFMLPGSSRGEKGEEKERRTNTGNIRAMYIQSLEPFPCVEKILLLKLKIDYILIEWEEERSSFCLPISFVVGCTYV